MSADNGDHLGSLVRPYAVTGGRTKTHHELAVEALVSTTEHGYHESASRLPEFQLICGLCRELRSVAEIASHLNVPLGVARVLVGDMVDEGLVRVHQPAQGRPHRALLERVLNGLRKL